MYDEDEGSRQQKLYNRLYSAAGFMVKEGVSNKLRKDHANLCWAIMLEIGWEAPGIKKLYAHHFGPDERIKK